MFGLQQRGASVGKTALFNGNECLTTSDVTGIVSGNSADLTIKSGMEIIELDASIDSSARTLTERRTCTASTLPCCDGETGNLSTISIGSADVRW